MSCVHFCATIRCSQCLVGGKKLLCNQRVLSTKSLLDNRWKCFGWFCIAHVVALVQMFPIYHLLHLHTMPWLNKILDNQKSNASQCVSLTTGESVLDAIGYRLWYKNHTFTLTPWLNKIFENPNSNALHDNRFGSVLDDAACTQTLPPSLPTLSTWVENMFIVQISSYPISKNGPK